jgi:DnaJ-class molecular chaperone
VEVQVAIPTHLSGEERKLLQRLNELQQERLRKDKSKQSASFIGKMKEAFAGT